MKFDNINFLNFNDWNCLDNFINPSSKIYGHNDLMRHISELKAYAKLKILELKWSA